MSSKLRTFKITYFQKIRTFKNTYFQNYVLSKTPPFNATIDTLNDVVKIVNQQVIRFMPADGPNPDGEDITHPVDYHHYLTEVNELTQEEWNDLLKI